MDESTEPIKLGYYIEAAFRRRWLIIIPFCLVMVVGIFLAIVLPKVYSATTLILVEPPRVPENYVRPVVSTEIEQRISTISQQIMSRTSLENIITQFNLFMEPGHENMFMEDKIEDLRKRITVEVITDRRREADAFSISFKGKDPEKVMSITNALSTYFINENLKQRETQAVGTSEFLEDELLSVRKQLEELENRLQSFREKHMGGLPEQLETNLRILDRLQEDFSEKQENLRHAKNRLIALNNQLSERPMLPPSLPGAVPVTSAESETDPYLRLQLLKQELSELQNRYTGRHPDVIRTKRTIKDLEQEIEREAAKTPGDTEARPATAPMHPYLAEQRRIQMQQRDETRLEIQKLESEGSNLLKQIAFYQKLVEDTPKKEQELTSIQRDYENMQDTYKSLLDRKMQAQMAVNMERKQQGEQFRIIDPARLPTKPVEPNMKKLFLLALMGGLGFGCGLVFLLEYFDTSIRHREDMEVDLGIPLLATIPRVYHPKDIMFRRVNNLLMVISLVFAFALVIGMGVLVINGVEQTMEAVYNLARL